MKILLINKFLYPKGGDAISTITTGRLLSSKGHRVLFWGMKHASNLKYLNDEYFIKNIDYENPGSFIKKIELALNMIYSFEAKSKIEQFIKIEKPEIVHLNNFAHQISPSILSVFKNSNIPTVMTMRDFKLVCPSYSMFLNNKPCEKCKNGKYFNCLLNKCSKNSYLKSSLNTFEMYLHHNLFHLYDSIDIYISPSKFLKTKCQEMGFKKEVEYLPNFVELEDFKPEYNWQERAIVYFGRLSQEKGLFTLLEAVRGLDLKLKIIGDGPLKQELRHKSQANGLTNVEFLGYKNGEELKNEIRKSMFVVLPSECYENNPRCIVEGFALGKTALGARIGGIPELLIENETGITFIAGDKQDLRKKIEYMLNNTEKILQMGKKSRFFVEREFSSERHYIKLMELYEKARLKHS